jgi:sulfoxide reductase heme-binding subunit YedZ
VNLPVRDVVNLSGREAAARSRQPSAGPRRTPALKVLVFTACLFPVAYIAWRGVTDRLGADPIRKVQIETGLWALRFLAATLTITPLRKATGWNALGKYRRTLGLFTFFYASLHLVWWIGVDWFFDFPAMWEEIVKHKYIFVGMATFLLMIPLAVTSTKGWIRRLGGARWNKLHRLVYLCAIGGTVHYLWAVKKDTFFPVVYFAVFGLLLGYRVYSWWGARRRRQRMAAVPHAATR